MEFDKYYTLDEAQALIPWIRRVFAEAHRILKLMQHRADTPVTRWPPQEHDRPSQPSPARVEDLTHDDQKTLVEGILSAIIQRGIVIQDFRRGLIDFPAMREGQAVFLCYELDDGDRIHAWHHLNAGFAGRRPIEEF